MLFVGTWLSAQKVSMIIMLFMLLLSRREVQAAMVRADVTAQVSSAAVTNMERALSITTLCVTAALLQPTAD